MARPVEYDLENVLNKAMEIFWEKGYTGVSMADIVSYTGLNRRTMYSLFEDKEGIFKASLEHYYTQKSASKIKILKENSGKKGLVLFFESFDFCEDFKGCLFSNTIREKVFLSDDTYSVPKEYFDKIGKQLEINLSEAKEEGEFTGDVVSMSLTLITLIHGFQVFGKYNHSKESSTLIINNIIGLIR